MSRRRILALFFVMALVGVIGYLMWVSRPEPNGPLVASGTIEAREVLVAPEIGGRVGEVLVDKGDLGEAGQVLFRLDDALLQAQRKQAQAALEAAQAQEALAEANLRLARLEYERVEKEVHLAHAPQRLQPWVQNPPDEFTLPLWYFTQDERLTAAEAEVKAAKETLEAEEENLAQLLRTATASDLQRVEERLARARERFLLAEALLEQAKAARDNEALEAYAQSLYDEALNELEAAQTEYDRLLTTQAAQDVLEARARVAVARERYDAALDRWYRLQSGPHALELRLAQARLEQARKALEQARAAVSQAQAQVELLDLQLEKLTVRAPLDGVVLARNVEPGEVVSAGATVLTLGDLSYLTIRVYIPVEDLGRIRLGDTARLAVDAYPGETFTAEVVYIADQAEYTPQNVQTPERRKTMVFAVELRIHDPAGRLRPGMPADVTFEE